MNLNRVLLLLNEYWRFNILLLCLKIGMSFNFVFFFYQQSPQNTNEKTHIWCLQPVSNMKNDSIIRLDS